MSDPILVTVSKVSGALVPSLLKTHVVIGQAITFRAVGSASTLYFSPDLVDALNPIPEASAALTPGTDLTYTFSSADPGAYEILFQDPSLPAPQQFDPPTADHTGFLLILRSASNVGHPLSPVHAPPPTVTIPNPVGTITSNPIQTLHAVGAAATPQAFFGEVETEDRSITSNPIQTLGN